MIADKLTVEQREKYSIRSLTDFAGDFASHTPRIAVLGNEGNAMASEWARILRTNGYTDMRTIGDTSIFVRCSRQ